MLAQDTPFFLTKISNTRILYKYDYRGFDVLDIFVQSILYGFLIYLLFNLIFGFFGKNTDSNYADPDIVAQIEQALLLCRAEKVNGTYYLYEMGSDAFVGQGNTTEDFVEISDRHQRYVVIMEGDQELLDELQHRTIEYYSQLQEKS